VTEGDAPPVKRSRRLAVWLVLLLVVANLPIFVLALASGLTVGDEKVTEAKRSVERVASLAAAREAVAVARLSGAVDAVAATFNADVPPAELCARLAAALLPLESDIISVRVNEGAIQVCAQAAGVWRSSAGVTPATPARGGDAKEPEAPRRASYTVPFALRDGRVLAVEIAPQSGPGALGDVSLDPEQTVAILDDNGHIVAASGDATVLDDAAALAETVEAVRARRFEVRLPDGRWMFAATEGVRGTELRAIAITPLGAIYAAARRDLALAIGLPLAFLAIAVAVAWYGIDRLVVRWVGRLGRVAALYGAGRLSVRVGRLPDAPREMRVLGHAFDDMADRVERRSNELKSAVEEKTQLLRELHHRVKNNFQLVASLLSLEGRDTSAENVRTLRVQQDRVHALAIAHRLAYAGGEVAGVPTGALLTEIVERLRQGAGVSQRHLTLTIGADVPIVHLDEAVPLAMLMTELVRPVVTAAAMSGNHTTIALTVGEGQLVLVVEGAGAATPDELSARLVTAFGRQLEAEVSLYPAAGRSVVHLPALGR
jgi:two-component sensor histidine kinase